MAQTHHIRWLLFACVFLFIWGLITHGNDAGTGDEPHYMMISHSLIQGHDLDLTDDYADRSNLVFDGRLGPEGHTILGSDHRLRPVHDIGMPLAFAPYFAVAYYVASRSATTMGPQLMQRLRLKPYLVLRHLLSFGMMTVSACLALLLFDTFFEISGRRTLSFSWALLSVLSPPILSHSFLFFTEIPTAFLAFLTLRRIHPKSPKSASFHFLTGIIVGYILLIHVRNVGLVLALILIGFLARLKPPCDFKGGTSFILGAGIAMGLRVWITHRFWGTFLTTPLATPGRWLGARTTVYEASSRLAAMCIDQEHGLLIFAPIYLISIVGIVILWRLRRGEAAAFTLPVVLYLLFVLLPFTNPYGWRGGWSPAARFLVPVIPFIAVWTFAAISTVPRWTWSLRLVIAVQCTIDLYVWHNPHLLWNIGNGRSKFLGSLHLGKVNLADFFPSWERMNTWKLIVATGFFVAWFIWTWLLLGRIDATASGQDHAIAQSVGTR